MRGTIVKSFIGRGFLFCKTEAGQTVFIHCKNMVPGECFDSLGIGDTVDFTLTETEKGPRGIDVRRVRA